jgi:oxygen-dependent protoporphyrinogen oxidase
LRLVEELTADLQRFGVDVRLGNRVTSTSDGVAMVGDRAVRGTILNSVPEGPTTPFTLVTLVLDAPELDAAPRGTGVLVGQGAPGIRARSLAHRTAKWEWLAERAGGKHIVRLSYDGVLDDEVATARNDAQALLGINIEAHSVIDAVATEWSRPVLTAGASVTATIATALERVLEYSADSTQ